MAVRKPTPRALAARREMRQALTEALRSVKVARRAIVKAGSLRADAFPTVFPPQVPTSVCKTITTDSIVLNPPYVPYYKCKTLFPPKVPVRICGFPPKPIVVGRKDFEKALDAIDLWIRYVMKVFDAASKRPARPKPRARR